MMIELPHRFLLLAVLSGILGMAMGIAMAAGHDFTLAPAHAHLNLLGWVSLSLYGLYYRAYPQAAEGWLPRLHFALATAGVAIAVPALALLLLGFQVAEPAVAVGSLLTIAGMLSFAAVVLLTARSARSMLRPAIGLRRSASRMD